MVRVSPGVPLRVLLPAVCDKCEFKVETTVLLRDCQSGELLDMSKTLNEHGLREVFARDTAAADQDARAKTPDSGRVHALLTAIFYGGPGRSKTLKCQINKTLLCCS